MEYERLLSYTAVERTYIYIPGIYIAKKGTYSYNCSGLLIRISAPRSVSAGYMSLWELLILRAAHFESCSSCGSESINICHFESCSLWELLTLGDWIKDCRWYEPSFVLTSATIVDGDTGTFLCRGPWCLRCSTSLSHEIRYFILNS